MYGLSNSTLPSNMVRCVAYNPIDSSIWFGTQYSGVTYISGDGLWQAPIVFQQLPEYPFDAIAFDRSSTWFGTAAGILQYATNMSVWGQYDCFAPKMFAQKSCSAAPCPWSVLHKVGTSDYYKYNTALDSVIEGNFVERDRRKMSRRRQKIKLLLVVVVWCK